MRRARRFTCLLIVNMYAGIVQGQVITTIAGTDWNFPSSAPLPARSAPLGKLVGIAVDLQGNLYVADDEIPW